MPKPDQQLLPLALGIRNLSKKAGSRLMEIIREVIRDSGKQEAAATAIGISPGLLSMALKSQRTFDLAWLPAILPFDHDHRILKYLAWESHCKVEPLEPFTDADFRKAADVVFREAGPLGEHLRGKIVDLAQGRDGGEES